MPDYEDTNHPASWADKPQIVLVVDESGSMNASRDTTVSAINDYLGGLKTSLPGTALVTVVKFDTSYPTVTGRTRATTKNNGRQVPSSMSRVRLETLFDSVPLSEVRTVTRDDYRPNGGTPLYDAIGSTITRIDDQIKAAPAPVYFGIITDGAENESREHKLATIQAMIRDRTATGWTFTFLGVAIDAYAEARNFGIAAGDTVTLSRDTFGAGLATMSTGVGRKFAGARSMNAESYASWNATPSNSTFTDEEKARVEDKK